MNSISRAFPALGASYEVSLSADHLDQDQLLDLSIGMQARIQKTDRLLSPLRNDSELSYINQTAGQEPVEAPCEFLEALAFALELAARTEGAISPIRAEKLGSRDLTPRRQSARRELPTWHDVSLSDTFVAFHRPLHLNFNHFARGWAIDRAISIVPPEVTAILGTRGIIRMTHWQDQSVLLQESGEIQQMLAAAAGTVSLESLSDDDWEHSPVQPYALDIDSVSVFADTSATAEALAKLAILHPTPHPIMEAYNARMILE
ncbi:MAG: FAD:protein FMN transferase [Verrucomicrobiota bacterium JB023]|nr:FAD:protein FMN transferase [Verrucomicrobiota bacterium JB023]